jgi:transposase
MDAVEEVIQLREALAAALARIAQLEKENGELRARLGQNSGNSSKPPSSDMGGRKRRPPMEPGGRKRGGQPGHEGKAREVVPAEQVDEVVDRDPEVCAICGAPLTDAPRLDAVARQVIETSEFKAFVKQYQLWRKRCPKCGGFTRGKMPPGSPKGVFGPRIQATVAMLSGRFRMTRREVKALAGMLLGVPMSLGSVQACCESASEAMASAHADLHGEVKAASAVHADETGFGRCGNARLWLWTAASGLTEAFRLLPGRGSEQAKDLLGADFSGILHRDRWKPYEHLDQATSQLCHAHIRRHLQAMLESTGETATQGAMLKLASDRAFHLWHQFEQRRIDRAELIRRMKPIQVEMRTRLERLKDGSETPGKHRGTAKDLLRQWEALWTYVHQDGAVPTNNEAERALRKAVLWRKGSFGVNSEAGARFVERILTLAGTTHLRGIDLLDWLTCAIQARLEGHPTPGLKPA